MKALALLLCYLQLSLSQMSCQDGGIRLMGGESEMEGRVEVCIDGMWGTVCDDFWSRRDAAVACRQLGYSRFNARAYTEAQFGKGSGPIHLDNVHCTGIESRLINCPNTDFDPHDCDHSEDAGVRCQPSLVAECEDGDVRLMGGESELEGRVEVCLDGVWGTVCDDYWSEEDARVVCRQLGHSAFNSTPYKQAHFGEGTGPTIKNYVWCTGSECSLFGCTSTWIPNDCSHSEDAGVECNPLQCQDGGIRLVGGQSPTEGRVEVCMDEVWGTVCHDSWSSSDAYVVCKQLGYSSSDAMPYLGDHFGSGNGAIHLDTVLCTGSESRLIDCPYSTHTANCTHNYDAGVHCQDSLKSDESSQGCNSDTVGGVLGTMLVILVLLLVGLGIAVAYLAFKLKKTKHHPATVTPLYSGESIERILHNPTYGAESPLETPPAPYSAFGPQYETVDSEDANTNMAHDYEGVNVDENGGRHSDPAASTSNALENHQYSHLNH